MQRLSLVHPLTARWRAWWALQQVLEAIEVAEEQRPRAAQVPGLDLRASQGWRCGGHHACSLL